jgi:hypothetical protein
MTGMPVRLYARLTGRAARPSLQRIVRLAFACGVSSLAISTWAFLNLPTTLAVAQVAAMAGLAVLFLTLAAPVLSALSAAIITGRDVNSEGFVLIRATAVTDRDIVAGYVYAALYRARLLIACAVGLFPVVVISLWQLMTQVTAFFYFFSRPSPSGGAVQYKLLLGPLAAVYPTPVDALAWLVLVAGLWGMNWAGASLATAMALWRRGFGLALAAAPALTLAIMVGVVWRFATLPYWKDVESLVWGLVMLASYPLAFLLMRIAGRWVRPGP